MAAVEGRRQDRPSTSRRSAQVERNVVPGEGRMNWRGVWAIYKFEMHRFRRTLWTGLAVPVITTSLYFIVFGSAIGSRISEIDGVDYGSFIVPGLMLLSLFTESIFNASFGIHMPRFTGTIYEILSAPLSALETVVGYVGAAATKSMSVAIVIFITAHLFVDVRLEHPFLMLLYLLLVAVTFCLFGFIVGIWAKGFEQLQVIPLLIVTPLTFLGGTFYSIDMLGEPWRTVTLFNPIVYLINGFRWTFFGTAEVAVGVSVAATFGFFLICLAVISWIFRTGYRLKQ
jgi:ABC-2 type transport system permease protein